MSASVTVGPSSAAASAQGVREPPCFTINACNRCRRRKAKCDPGLPSCGPCRRTGAVCEYTDPRSKTATPRAVILQLEDELARLEADLRAQSLSEGCPSSHGPVPPPGGSSSGSGSSNGPDLIRLEPGEDAHFLGVSSGMHLARSVLESAQRNDASFQPGRRSGSGSGSGGDKDGSSGTNTTANSGQNSGQSNSAASTQPGSPRDETTEGTAQSTEPTESTASTATEPPEPSHASHPTRPVLPSRETAVSLVDIFLSQYEVQYPIVTGDDMAQIVMDYYGGDSASGAEDVLDHASVDRETNAWNQFILNMVFAIALVVLSRESPESLALAKSFSNAAMADFSTIMQRKSVRTLQCLLFLLLWSVLDSSSAPIWYISGLCMRMCVDLGFHSETTIDVGPTGTPSLSSPPSPSEMDVKRRLFWVTYTFDRTLGTLLGRPFTLTDSMIDVKLPQHAPSGPKRDKSDKRDKRDQVLHWFRLQQLQSQIVCRLYSLRSGDSKTDRDDGLSDDTARWKADMAAQLRQWGSQATSLADPQGHTLDWWEYWHQNALLLLHRPSPLKPQLDAAEADTCCTAAQHMIQLSFTRLQRGSADFAWVDLHYQLMSGITLLFLVWKHAATRAKAKAGWTSFKNCLMQWTYVLDQLARQWDRISRARDVLTRLVDTTIDIVEKELCNKLSASDVRVLRRQAHASRMSRNKTIIRQLGSPGTVPTGSSSSSKSPAEPEHSAQQQQRHRTRSTRRQSSQRAQEHCQQPDAQPADMRHQQPQQTRHSEQQQPLQHPQHQHAQQQQQPPHHVPLQIQPPQPQSHAQHPIHTGGPSPPQQELSYERSTSYGTPSSDTAVNTSQSVGSAFLNHADSNNNGNNMYTMQVSPSHSGQPISPQWISPATDPAANHALPHSHGHHPLPLVAPFHNAGDLVPAHSQSHTDPVVQLLDQQAWHGLELYESFGALPDNSITMLDYFSATPLGMEDGSLGGVPLGRMDMESTLQHAHVPDGAHHPPASHDMVGVWPNSLTNSILNFQPTFHDLGDFGS